MITGKEIIKIAKKVSLISKIQLSKPYLIIKEIKVDKRITLLRKKTGLPTLFTVIFLDERN